MIRSGYCEIFIGSLGSNISEKKEKGMNELWNEGTVKGQF